MTDKTIYFNSKENVPDNEQSDYSNIIKLPNIIDRHVSLEKESSHGSVSFRDTDCGEPFHVQRLNIDFSPEEGVDDDPVLLNKCCNFWDFIKTVPDVTAMEAESEIATSSSSEVTIIEKDISEMKIPEPDNMSAVFHKDIAWFKYKDAVKRSFAANMNEFCDERQYKEDSSNKEKIKKGFSKRVGENSFVQYGSLLDTSNTNKTNAKNLCNELEEWDANHPQSMEPPGHPPCSIPTRTIETPRHCQCLCKKVLPIK